MTIFPGRTGARAEMVGQESRSVPERTRHLLGKPMSVEWLKTVLRDGRQRQRAAAAVGTRHPPAGPTLFNVAAPGDRQIELSGRPAEPIR